MARYTGPKDKLSRRFGVNLFGGESRSLHRRLNTPPGEHGTARRRKLSEYAVQLREKQKVKLMYGVLERQFRRYFELASRRTGQTGVLLLQTLERRLDNVVYRLGFAKTRPQARQLVTHGHLKVNDRPVNIPSYQVRPGEVIALGAKALVIPDVQDLVKRGPERLPSWLLRDGPSGRVIGLPGREDIGAEIQENLIVELYRR